MDRQKLQTSLRKTVVTSTLTWAPVLTACLARQPTNLADICDIFDEVVLHQKDFKMTVAVCLSQNKPRKDFTNTLRAMENKSSSQTRKV